MALIEFAIERALPIQIDFVNEAGRLSEEQIVGILKEQFGERLFEATGGGGSVQLLTDGRDIFARTAGGDVFNLLNAADSDGSNHLVAARVENAHICTLLAEHVKPRAIGRKQNLQRRRVFLFVVRGLRGDRRRPGVHSPLRTRQ